MHAFKAAKTLKRIKKAIISSNGSPEEKAKLMPNTRLAVAPSKTILQPKLLQRSIKI